MERFVPMGQNTSTGLVRALGGGTKVGPQVPVVSSASLPSQEHAEGVSSPETGKGLMRATT